MTEARIVAIAAALAFGAAATSMAQEREQEITRTVSVTGNNEQVYETNGFQVVSTSTLVESSQKNELGSFAPTESHEIQALYVTGDLPFKLVVQNTGVTSQGGSVGIYHSETGRPILTVGDANADGRIDVLTYAVLDAEGETVIEVVDYEADGQSDLRANFQDGHFEIWHLDRWHRAETRDGQRGIVVDGAFVPLERRENRWIVP